MRFAARATTRPGWRCSIKSTSDRAPKRVKISSSSRTPHAAFGDHRALLAPQGASSQPGSRENNTVSSAGAEGWMQFMPETWAAYGVDANGDGVKDPFNAADAIFAATRYLRASGAPGDWREAIFAYNHADWYVADVLARAERFAGEGGAILEVAAESVCSTAGPASGRELMAPIPTFASSTWRNSRRSWEWSPTTFPARSSARST